MLLMPLKYQTIAVRSCFLTGHKGLIYAFVAPMAAILLVKSLQFHLLMSDILIYVGKLGDIYDDFENNYFQNVQS